MAPRGLSQLLILAVSCAALAHGATYPRCWAKEGECLDNNKGPLLQGVQPQMNPNIIVAVPDVLSLDECVSLCAANETCSYFTYYDKPILADKRVSADCQLVGFNLKSPCWLLNNTCVLLKECLTFNETCTSCRTGKRPLMNPADEPVTLIMNGVTDERNYKMLGVEQYDEHKGNVVEAIFNKTFSCKLDTSGMAPRYGSAAGYINNMIVNCGGFSANLTTPDYLTTCSKLVKTGSSLDWTDFGNLATKRAFATSVAVKSLDGTAEYVYVMGGYNSVDGFLDSVEAVDKTGAISVEATITLPVKMSHFCAVLSMPASENRFLYVIGGWNIAYLKTVYRLKIDAAGKGTGAWEKMEAMYDTRSDMACGEIQVGWLHGIVATGGYKLDGAWMKTNEFFDYSKSKWRDPIYFPVLEEARHYHGLTTLGMKPTIFGGWNNGSADSIEMLNDCKSSNVWETLPLKLKMGREKFAVAYSPPDFITSEHCV